MFGRKGCLVCKEKDRRIDDLQKQIAMLSRLAVPSTTQSQLPVVNVEANRVLDGDHTPMAQDEMDETEKEAIRLLTGSY
jgi:hypothetical protein